MLRIPILKVKVALAVGDELVLFRSLVDII